MQNIDIKYLNEIKEELDELEGEDSLFIEENGEPKFAIIPIEFFDALESYRGIIEGNSDSSVKVISNVKDALTYDEYENIKKQLIDVFDKTFKPNPEKLN